MKRRVILVGDIADSQKRSHEYDKQRPQWRQFMLLRFIEWQSDILLEKQ
nr:hypothetical protein [Izhakiella capsodis]